MVEENGGVVSDNPYRTYGKHEYEDILWEWFHDLEERFPCEIECDFIEVSPNINSFNAKAYKRNSPRSVFIRFSSGTIERYSDEKLKRVLLHEMVHLYTYQKGYAGSIGDGSPMFKWICGQVGTRINQVSDKSRKWERLADPFLEDL